MHQYILVQLVFICVFSIAIKYNRNHLSKGLISILIAIVFLAFISKGITGSDTPKYIILWNRLLDANYLKVFDFYNTEYAFFSYAWLLGQISKSPIFYYVFTVITPISILIISYYQFNNLLKYPSFFFALMVFLLTSTSAYYLLYSNVIRQGFAVSLSMLALAYYFRSKFLLSILFLTLAFYCHRSSLIFGILIAFDLLRFNDKMLFLGLIFATLFGGIEFSDFFPKSSWIYSKLSLYSQYGQNENLWLKKIVMFVNLGLFFLILRNKTTSIGNRVLRMYVVLCAVILLFSNYKEVSSRLIYYNSFIEVLLFSIVAYHFRKDSRDQIVFNILAFLYFCFVITHPSVIKNLTN